MTDQNLLLKECGYPQVPLNVRLRKWSVRCDSSGGAEASVMIEAADKIEQLEARLHIAKTEAVRIEQLEIALAEARDSAARWKANSKSQKTIKIIDLEVIATRCDFGTGYYQYHDKYDPMPLEWDDRPPEETMQLCALVDALEAIRGALSNSK